MLDFFFFFFLFFFFFNDTATTEIYTLSLHDALPIWPRLLYCPFLVAAAPLLFKMPISRCGSAPLFILPISRCGSAPAFFIDQFSWRQRPRFLKCPSPVRSEEHTSELQSPVPISYAVFCLKKKKNTIKKTILSRRHILDTVVTNFYVFTRHPDSFYIVV